MKKQNLNSLKLNKKSVSNLSELDIIVGGNTLKGSCQTASCVCTDNPLVCAPSWDGGCGSGQLMCTSKK